jgi:hypothetical protein
MPVLISPSQLKTYLSCPRQWGYVYLLGRREPTSKAANLGIQVHSHTEEYYRDGAVPPATTLAGRIALAYIAEIERPSGTGQEQAFTLGSRWRGIIDAIGPGFIEDTKTTSDLKWALTEETLRYDVQAIIYAAHYFDIFQLAERVELRWNYVTTRPIHKVKKVHLTVLRSEISSEMMRLEALNDQLQEHYAANDLQSLPRNLNSCGKYGGCPHRDDCSPNDNPFAEEEPPMNAAATTPTFLSRAIEDGWKPHPANPKYYFKKGVLPKEVVLSAELAPMYPDDAPPALPVEEAHVEQPLNPPATDFRQSAAAMEEAAYTGIPEKALEAPAETEEKRGRGRPPGAKNKPKPLDPAVVAEAVAAELARMPAAAPVVQAPIHHPPATGRVVDRSADVAVLYVDCLPMSGIRPTDVVRAIADDVAALENANSVAHWKQVPYGQGTALLVVAARNRLKEYEGDLFLDTRTEEGSAILSACVNHVTKAGGFVVRGLR